MIIKCIRDLIETYLCHDALHWFSYHKLVLMWPMQPAAVVCSSGKLVVICFISSKLGISPPPQQCVSIKLIWIFLFSSCCSAAFLTLVLLCTQYIFSNLPCCGRWLISLLGAWKSWGLCWKPTKHKYKKDFLVWKVSVWYSNLGISILMLRLISHTYAICTNCLQKYTTSQSEIFCRILSCTFRA